MIKHIVCYNLLNKDDAIKVKELFLSMKGIIPQIKDIEVGIDFLGSSRSADVVLSVVFESKKAMEDYQQNKYHAEVVKAYMRSVVKSSVSVDYEIE